MSDEAASPLMGRDSSTSSSKKSSKKSASSDLPSEATPLLSQSEHTPRYDGDEDERVPSRAASSLRSIQSGESHGRSSKGASKLPTIIALSVLGVLVILIISFGFMAPALAEEYAKEALVIEATSLSIHEFTTAGVTARIQGNFQLDAKRVKRGAVRNIGQAGTWLARKIESKPSELRIYVPEYGNLLLGSAAVPGLTVDIRAGQTTHLDFLAHLKPGELDVLRMIANDWLEGRLGSLRVQGKADVELKSGLIPLGTQSISESFVFEGNDIPVMPQYNITRLNFREAQLPFRKRAMAADVSLSVFNDFPVALEIPPLGFDILIPNCAAEDPYILLADAITDSVIIAPSSEVKVDVGGIVRELPKDLTKSCPHSSSSPFDIFFGNYMRGNDNTIYVRGSNSPVPRQPEWMVQLLSSVTVSLPFRGHTFDSLIRNFSLTDVHFTLPDPLADPDSSDSNPQISANINLLAALPKEMNFGINVSQVRANADVFYKEKKLGVLKLRKWQAANSTRIEATKKHEAALKIESKIENAPLEITDDDVFTEVIQALVFSGKPVQLKIDANVDVEVGTVLGKFVIKDVPAQGNVPVKPILSNGTNLTSLNPKVGDIRIRETTETSIFLTAHVNFTNPTVYIAQVPYININILNNGSIVGRASAKNVVVSKGNNTGIAVEVVWDPSGLGGRKGAAIARELLSQYVSGWNTTLTFQTHEGTFPLHPNLGKALSKFNVTIPTPRFGPSRKDDSDDDGEDDEEDPHKDAPKFVKDAVFHFFSSTASFTLLSPLQHTTIYIDTINATAFYNHTEDIGQILYDLPFAVPPSVDGSQTPRLPVDWSLGSVGYEAVRKALGGVLKLDAKARIGVRVGRWREEIWFEGGGIGARVSV